MGDKPAAQDVPVEVVKIRRGPISSFILASSTVKSISQVEVHAEVTGIVSRIYKEEGDRIRRGRMLALIRNPLLKIAYEKAKLNVEKLKRDRKATKGLMDKGISSKSQYEEIDFRYRQALIDLKRARQDRTNLWVTAPVSGVIASRNVKRGERASPNKHLYSIVDPDKLEVDVHLPEKHLPQVKEGQEARILATSLDKIVFCGKVKRVSPVVNKVSGTVKVTVQVSKHRPLGQVCPKPKKKKKTKSGPWLRPGMYVDVRIITRTVQSVLIVPRKALIHEEAKTLVYIVRDNKARRRQVVIGDQYRNMIEIRSGVREGEQVIIVGHHGLKEGARVRLIGKKKPKSGVPAASPGKTKPPTNRRTKAGLKVSRRKSTSGKASKPKAGKKKPATLKRR